jgi:tetratricopeptide (TPR) repeat protein
MMNKKYVLFLWMLFLVDILSAQNARAYERAADKALTNNDLYSSIIYYQNAIALDSTNFDWMYKLADAAEKFNSYDLAETYFDKIRLSPHRSEFAQVDFRAASIKKQLGKYDEAIAILEIYKKIPTLTLDNLNDADYAIIDCRKTKMASIRADSTQITHLDKTVNSEFSEFAPALWGDSLVFTSYRFKNKKDNHDPKRIMSKVLFKEHNEKKRAQQMTNVNEEHISVGHTALSLDNQRLYCTQCQYIDNEAAAMRCKLYYRNREKNNHWSNPIPLPDLINGAAYTSTMPALGRDSLGAEILYFVSDRPDGKGKMDIWAAKVLPNDVFEQPYNLPLNTEKNDITPFFHTKSQTLFFSSDGRGGMGGYDCFSTRKKNRSWGVVRTISAPVNTGYNDIYLWVAPDSLKGYLASNRPGSMYLDAANKTCCYDIYELNFPKKKKINVTEIIDNHYVLSKQGKRLFPKNAILKDLDTATMRNLRDVEDLVPITVYFDNDQPKRGTNDSMTVQTYAKNYKDFVGVENEYWVNYAAVISKEETTRKRQAVTAFFDKKVTYGYQKLQIFSEKILEALEAGDTITINMRGFTSPSGLLSYNYAMARRRTQCIENELINSNNQALKPYIDNGQLMIFHTSLGDLLAPQYVVEEMKQRGSAALYSLDVARERRVEIFKIERKKQQKIEKNGSQ